MQSKKVPTSSVGEVHHSILVCRVNDVSCPIFCPNLPVRDPHPYLKLKKASKSGRITNQLHELQSHAMEEVVVALWVGDARVADRLQRAVVGQFAGQRQGRQQQKAEERLHTLDAEMCRRSNDTLFSAPPLPDSRKETRDEALLVGSKKKHGMLGGMGRMRICLVKSDAPPTNSSPMSRFA